MAIAGRILIMPKGAYDESITYEMLDMVSHNGSTWLAKKTCVGIEPSAANEEYWFNMVGFNSADLGKLKEDILKEVDGKGYLTEDDIKVTEDTLKGYLPLQGGTMSGTLKAVNPGVNTEGVRNIVAGTEDLTAGTSALATGSIYIVYE